MNKKDKWLFWRKLDKRLILIICITVIPINLLSIGLSRIALEESRERVIISIEKEFDIFMNREAGLFEKLDDWYVEFVQKYLMLMTYPNAFNAVSSISIVNEVGNAFTMYGIQGFMFLEEQQGDRLLYMKGTRGLYSLGQLMDMKESFRMQRKEYVSEKSWHIESLAGEYYYIKSYSYLNYNIGFGIDLRAGMQLWLHSQVMKDCQMIVTDGRRLIWMDTFGRIEEISNNHMNSFLNEDAGKKIISSYTPSVPLELKAYLINKWDWSFTPFAYLLLQAVAWFSVLILLLLWFVIRRQVMKPLKILQMGMWELDRQELYYRIEEQASTEDFRYIYDVFNKMADDILKSHEKDILLYQTRLDNLKLQVNPHMLLNSLTMIYSLAETQQNRLIQKFTMNLVEYFRYCLKENNTLVSLGSEMKFIENYIEIQKIRFPGELASAYTVDENLLNALIPPLLVQNLVENATKYARIPDKIVEVLINIRKEGNKLFISVSDTGKGMDREVAECLNSGELYIDRDGNRHIGIWNCRRRLEAFYGKDIVLHITSTKGEGTQVWIELPFKTEGDEDNEPVGCR